MYYSGHEIVEIAVRIEENGFAYYNAAASMIRNQTDIKALFTDLAQKELQHIAIFMKLLSRFEPENYDIPQDDAEGYIHHLAESHIFGKPGTGEKLAATVKTAHEALEIAYKFENDSVAFYTELEKRAKSDSKRLVRQIIEEEKEHAEDIKRFLDTNS
jgi:rubrerythrin